MLVALTGGRVNRRQAAGALWPYGDDERASGNLRSALWRLRCAGIDILQGDKCSLYLDPDSTVDIAQLYAWANRIIDGSADDTDFDVVDLNLEAVHLLPGWYEDWIVFERERLRQRLLHAMESLARRRIECRHFAGAIEAAMLAVGIEPLRESAQRVLIEAHLAEGNVVEACRVFVTYRDLVTDELGVQPSRDLAEIFSSVPDAPEHNRSITAPIPTFKSRLSGASETLAGHVILKHEGSVLSGREPSAASMMRSR
jgi:DNA-binding SARP family transcriptional activator